MLVTQKNILKLNKEETHIVERLCYHSARLYNVGLYSVRQYFFCNNEYLNYAQNYHECKDNENYKLLLSDTAQQMLRIVDRNFKSFFKLLKLKSQGKYSAKINIPHYKRKEQLSIVPVQGRSVRVKNGKIYIGLSKAFRELYNPKNKDLVFTLPKHMQHVQKINEARIIPKFGGLLYEIEYVYERPTEQHHLNTDNILSIDCGLDNFATCVNTANGASFIMNGRKIKAYNQWYNKTKAKFQSIYDKQGYKNTKRTCRYATKRYNKINDFLNRSVKYITDYCLQHNIGTLVIEVILKTLNVRSISVKRTTKALSISHMVFSSESLQVNVSNLAYRITFKKKVILQNVLS